MSELHRERASALGRIGGVLENLIATLESIRAQFPQMSAAHRRDARDRYATLYEKARIYRWYLEVQREAVGLRRHDVLDEQYRLPPAQL